MLPRMARAVLGGRLDIFGEITYLVTDGERTLLDIARQHDLGILEISALNPGIDAWVPGLGRLIVLPTAHILPAVERRGIIVNLAELRLYYFPEQGPPEMHAIGIGRDGFTTPKGRTVIQRKAADPVWYPTEATRADKPDLPKVVPPGPDNPLGRHALYLGWPTYLIHGTNKPYGVGRRVSRGCIRMYPESVEELFEKVPVGTPVEVIEEPIKLGWAGGELFIEVHPDLDQLDELEVAYRFDLKPPPDVEARIRLEAGAEVDRVAWNIVKAELIGRRGVPVKITRAPGEIRDEGGTAAARIAPGFVGLY